MKTFIFPFITFLILVSCSQKKTDEIPDFNNPKTTEVLVPEANPETTKTPATDTVSEGKSLVEGADCLGCHKVSEKLVGPSYQEIAKKYSEKDADLLAEKIIGGGSGNWGSIPMSAHPGMSQENARKMVAYILSLKK